MDTPNILLLVLDSVRAKNVSHLGYQRETTPELDAFAKRSTTYLNARSPGIHSISSHVSIFTGLGVAEHQATSHTAQIESGHTIWEELTGEGYRTGLFTPNAIVAESSNLASFFETVVGPKRKKLVFLEALGPGQVEGNTSYGEYLAAAARSDSPIKAIINGIYREFGRSISAHDPMREHAGEYLNAFETWRDSADGPWAACINLMDAHYPYLPQERYSQWGGSALEKLHQKAIGGPLTAQYLGDRPFWELEATESLYDDCIRQVDDYVGDFLTELDNAGELNETLVVITSDHGEGFGEYSLLNSNVRLIDHSWGIGDEVTHVPLLVKPPGSTSNKTVTEPATLTQFPTVVRETVNGNTGSFVPETGEAVTSSYRVEEPGNNLPIPADERKPYFGPWHAVCRMQNEQILVDAVRREDHVRYSPVVRQNVKSGDPDYINSVMDEFSSANIRREDNTINDEVEQRLHELGYKT